MLDEKPSDETATTPAQPGACLPGHWAGWLDALEDTIREVLHRPDEEFSLGFSGELRQRRRERRRLIAELKQLSTTALPRDRMTPPPAEITDALKMTRELIRIRRLPAALERLRCLVSDLGKRRTKKRAEPQHRADEDPPDGVLRLVVRRDGGGALRLGGRAAKFRRKVASVAAALLRQRAAEARGEFRRFGFVSWHRLTNAAWPDDDDKPAKRVRSEVGRLVTKIEDALVAFGLELSRDQERGVMLGDAIKAVEVVED